MWNLVKFQILRALLSSFSLSYYKVKNYNPDSLSMTEKVGIYGQCFFHFENNGTELQDWLLFSVILVGFPYHFNKYMNGIWNSIIQK